MERTQGQTWFHERKYSFNASRLKKNSAAKGLSLETRPQRVRTSLRGVSIATTRADPPPSISCTYLRIRIRSRLIVTGLKSCRSLQLLVFSNCSKSVREDISLVAMYAGWFLTGSVEHDPVCYAKTSGTASTMWAVAVSMGLIQ